MTSGFDCAQMTLKDYQLLLDRGWRRCGTYFYKPHVEFCCCRTFSIRLLASEYKFSNSQKKVMKKFEKMLNIYEDYSEQKWLRNMESNFAQSVGTDQQKPLYQLSDEDNDENEFDDDEDEQNDLLYNNNPESNTNGGGLGMQIPMKRKDHRSVTQISQFDGQQEKNQRLERLMDDQKESESQNMDTKESWNKKGQLSQEEVELQSEITEQTWKVLRLCFDYIKDNLQEFMEMLGVPKSEKWQELILDDRIMEASRVYRNKNLTKYGSHSTNIIIIFYRLNVHVWGEVFQRKDIFLARSFAYLESLLERTSQLQKSNLILKFRTVGEINIRCQKRSFIKRLAALQEIRQTSKLSFIKSRQNLLQSDSNSDPQQQSQPIIPVNHQPTQQFQSSTSQSKEQSGFPPQTRMSSRTQSLIPGIKLKKQNFLIPTRRKEFYREIRRAEYNEESYELYKRYNRVIHNNMKTSKESYKNFLCVNGLAQQQMENSQGKVLEFGCFHFKYFLDSVLIAVSVVDILPDGLSNVYYFYEPELKKYSLGVIGNLRDIEYIKDMTVYFPNFKYYHLGYYIHNNSKMSYKASYRPFDLLCPITYRWVTYDNVTQASIKEGESPRLCSNLPIIEDMDFNGVEIDKFVQHKVKLYISGRYIKINQIKQSFITYFQYLLQKLVILLGKQLAESLVFGQQ